MDKLSPKLAAIRERVVVENCFYQWCQSTGVPQGLVLLSGLVIYVNDLDVGVMFGKFVDEMKIDRAIWQCGKQSGGRKMPGCWLYGLINGRQCLIQTNAR